MSSGRLIYKVSLEQSKKSALVVPTHERRSFYARFACEITSYMCSAVSCVKSIDIGPTKKYENMHQWMADSAYDINYNID